MQILQWTIKWNLFITLNKTLKEIKRIVKFQILQCEVPKMSFTTKWSIIVLTIQACHFAKVTPTRQQISELKLVWLFKTILTNKSKNKIMIKKGFIHGETGLILLHGRRSNNFIFVTSEILKFAISIISLKLYLKLYLA